MRLFEMQGTRRVSIRGLVAALVIVAGTGTVSAAEPAGDASLASVLDRVRGVNHALPAELSERESRFAEKRDEALAQLKQARARIESEEAEGRRLEGRFDANATELDDKALLLKDKIGALKELFGVFQQSASDLIGAFNGSATSIQYPGRDAWLEAFANRMKSASEVSSVDDIKALWFEMQREITARGDIVTLRAPVRTPGGDVVEREIVRVGGFNLITAEPAPAYLAWDAGTQQVLTLDRQPAGPYLTQIDRYLGGSDGLGTLSVDPTGGVLVSLLAEKPTLSERIDQGALVGYMILGLGAIALVLAVFKLLHIGWISLLIASQRRRMNTPRRSNALGRLVLVYQDSQRVDPETLQLRLHDQLARESARIRRFTIFLAIIAAVAPLMGLLGTVVGMINTFQAITLYGTGDPQTMAGGISQALITTVLGLVVAVPAVLLHAVVNARARSLVNLLTQQVAILTGDRLAQRNAATIGERPRPTSLPPAHAAPA